MQIRELAERILFGDRWEDKLVALDRYEDSAPGTAFVVPERPGRPVGLGLDEWHGREKMRFREIFYKLRVRTACRIFAKYFTKIGCAPYFRKIFHENRVQDVQLISGLLPQLCMLCSAA